MNLLPDVVPQHTLQRYRVQVTGQVQGVGFRPFVYALATERGLSGWVRNDGAGVTLEVQGAVALVQAVLTALREQAPPLARVDAVTSVPLAPQDEVGFRIMASAGGPVNTGIPPDTAVCPACLVELFDPLNRRYRYPFINCTHCGPRYTLTRALPYDRPNTSMAGFVQCPVCQGEYDHPADRRFHAQPNACPVCGPQLRWLDAQGTLDAEAETGALLRRAVADLRAGAILAVKGLGGFHLLCRADAADVVARLRERKHREAKPFAVMVARPQVLTPWVLLDAAEQQLLHARERPIVLLRKQPGCDAALAGVAPDLAWLGAMLPYTPLHYLLFHEAAGCPAGTDWLLDNAPLEAEPLVLVCTSANPGGEPLVIDNAEAVQRLKGIADAFLLHDRDILIRCDDSVVRVGVEGAAFLRRARGYTPQPLQLPQAGPSVLALGGWLKNTLCVTRGAQAFISQHIGDLDNAATCQALEAVAAHLTGILAVRPERVACDRHPDFFSSHLAASLAEQWQVPLITVQHHHAHLAAVQAEHGLSGPVIGVAMDGVGLGDDGQAWGGELLHLEGTGYTRLGHLLPLLLPGGDRAAREPWRMAAAALHALGQGGAIASRFAEQRAAARLHAVLQHHINCPPTTSLGRYFDAAAGLLGIQPVARFEGQAAMRLEGLAAGHGPVSALTDGWVVDAHNRLDLCPLLAWLAAQPLGGAGDGRESLVARAAAVFHATLAAALADWVRQAAATQQVRDIVFSGGCVLNQVLMQAILAHLAPSDLRVYLPRLAPPNDGGLSLGQAWVAMRQ